MRPDRIVDLLPEVFRRATVPGEVLDVVIGTMAQLHAPVEAVLDDFDAYLDPYRCPPAFVPYLAEWVGLGWLRAGSSDAGDLPLDERPLRDLVANAEPLAKAQGTADGLARFLSLATGTGPFDVGAGDPAGEAFHVVVRGPADSAPMRPLIEHIVGHEKPAFATAAVALGQEEPRRLGRRWAAPGPPAIAPTDAGTGRLGEAPPLPPPTDGRAPGADLAPPLPPLPPPPSPGEP